MLKRNKALQSTSQIVLRNSVIVILVGFNIIFFVVPVIIALMGSFHQWDPIVDLYKFIGLENYQRMFTSPVFWRSMLNTAVFCFIVIFFRVLLGLGLAWVLNSTLIWSKSVFRTIFYMPTVAPMVAGAYIWKLIYHPQFGVLNQLLGTHINWLNDSLWAMPAIILMTVWKDFGYAVVIFIAGISSLPQDCFESAKIDGASGSRLFFRIALPLLKPTTLFVVVTSIISYLQTYVQVMVLTNGGPGTSTYISAFIIYQEAFERHNFGYASAISFFLLVVTAFFSYLLFRLSGKNTDY